MSPFRAKKRLIEQEFETHFFKPRGIPMRELELVSLTHDEMEAIRLIDVEHLNQLDAADKMQISRGTIQRVIDQAREKVGRALINGMAIEIGGGNYTAQKCGNGLRKRAGQSHNSSEEQEE